MLKFGTAFSLEIYQFVWKYAKKAQRVIYIFLLNFCCYQTSGALCQGKWKARRNERREEEAAFSPGHLMLESQVYKCRVRATHLDATSCQLSRKRRVRYVINSCSWLLARTLSIVVEGQSNSGSTTQHGHASFSGPIWKETESIETEQNSSTDNEGDRTNELSFVVVS